MIKWSNESIVWKATLLWVELHWENDEKKNKNSMEKEINWNEMERFTKTK